MKQQIFESPGFKLDLRSREEKHGDVGARIIVFLLAVAIISGICISIANRETYANLYSISILKSEKADYCLSEKAYVYFAPITSSGSYIGQLSSDIVIKGAKLYVADYTNPGFDEPETYIGIKAAYLRGVSELDFSNEKDEYVWVRAYSIHEIPPEDIP